MKNKAKSKILFCCLFIVSTHTTFSQIKDSIQLKNRKKAISILVPSAFAATSTALYFAWYKDYGTGKFHFFNDSKEWLQMDKVGHATSTYQGQRYTNSWFKWAGFSSKQSVIYSSVLSLGFLSTVEVMDGFSDGWGFSNTDMIANVAGISLFSLQEYFFERQFLQLKYSYHTDNNYKIRPNLLGSNIAERFIKDYNGQTYWLSINTQIFSKKLPKWLCLSLGYGANGMVGADDNIFMREGIEYNYSNLQRYRQYYFSFDVDLTQINAKKKWINTLLHTVSFIKIPFPTIEINKPQGFVIKPFYF
ncbi:MAG: DUF2279 domain-containing protein [Bacteroidota bacterium]